MIDGVILHSPTRRPMGERGYWFEEVIQVTDDFFAEGFGQWSRTKMATGTIKAWHIHQRQTDWWMVESGLIKAVVCKVEYKQVYVLGGYENILDKSECQEFILGDDQLPAILKIPPGIAHGLKVLQGPAVLSYITSHVYNPEDEGRIPFDALGYDWLKQDIR